MTPLASKYTQNTYSSFLIVGVALLSVAISCLLITSFLFICGSTINPFIFPLALFLSVLVISVLAKNKSKAFSLIIIHLATIAILIVVNSNLYDYSYDGIRYHQDIIYQLKNGWNPFYQHYAPGSDRLWVHHYAKGLETIGATIYATMGKIEAGKAANSIIVLSSFCFTYNFLSSFFSFISRKRTFLITLLFTFSVPVICQLFTFYIDWSAYSLLVIITTSIPCARVSHKHLWHWIIGGIIILSASIKFNIFFWILFTVSAYSIVLLLTKEYTHLKCIISTTVIASLIGIFIVSFNPYITNTINHQNPFYPLMGNNDIDIMTDNTPNALKEKGRVESTVLSLLSFPMDNADDGDLCFAFPWSFSYKQISYSGKVDTRIGGFGIFFTWILSASIVLYVLLYLREKRKDLRPYNIILLLLGCSLFILPSGWWSRYVAFFYAFPLIILLSSEVFRDKKWVRYFQNAVYLMLILNISASLIAMFGTSIYKRQATDSYLNVLTKSKEPILINFMGNTGFKIKLEEANIQYKEVPSEQLDTTILFKSVGVQSSQLEELTKQTKINIGK